MRIKKFKAKNIYGFMSPDIEFNTDLTFLTGINGSGKTTIVRGISSLITPSIKYLAHIEFEEMSVDIIDGENQITIWAKKENEQIILGNSTISEVLTLQTLSIDSIESSYQIEEKENDYYREIESQNKSHPIMKFYNELTPPMFLGIERRSSEVQLVERMSTSYYRLRRRNRNLFENPLSISLTQAAQLAEYSYRKIQAQQNEITDKLRKDLIMSGLKYEEFEKEHKIAVPSNQILNIEATKKNLQSSMTALGISYDEVELQFEPFFEKLQSLSQVLGDSTSLESIIEGKDEEKKNVVYEWIANYQQFNRMNRILNFIDEYIFKSQRLNEPTERYLNIVNNFLKDSSKAIMFDQTGLLNVRNRDGELTQITSLSSGESQIVVIITHLSFNPAAQKDNVFIIDEPELSLHVRWQELFVNAIITANPNMQIILATHSPSIILDDIQHCIDLSERGK